MHAKEAHKSLLRELDDHGGKSVEAARMTFGELAGFYEATYLTRRNMSATGRWPAYARAMTQNSGSKLSGSISASGGFGKPRTPTWRSSGLPD
jgi:hypothetical protein